MIPGVRTKHDIDVYITGNFAGLTLRWLVECKHHAKPLSKSYVLTFCRIVEEIGAPGFMMAEKGYQSGAQEAATSTNVTLTSLAELRNTASDHIATRRADALLHKLADCSARLERLHTTKTRLPGLTHITTLAGAGSTIELHARLSLAERGLEYARLGRLPAPYGFSIDSGREVRLVAQTMPELLTALEQVATDIASELVAKEALVAAGPDAHLLRPKPSDRPAR
jgi:hypothetical protein